MNKFIFFALVVIFISCFEPYRNHKLFNLKVQTIEQRKGLEKLEIDGKIDVWTEYPVDGKYTVRVAPENMADFIAYVLHSNVHIELIDNDIQEMVDKEKIMLSKRNIYLPNIKSLEEDFFKNFRDLEEIKKWMEDKVQNYPDIVSVEDIGTSYEGRPVLALRIEGNRGTSKPAVVFNGGIHAREWISPMTVLYIANELITKYNTDPKIKHIVDNISWRIIPNSNPDGYEYTWRKERLWRKTRSPNQGSTCIGTDANRNWAYKWATAGSSSNPCSDIYHGPKPFSDPETLAVAEYINRTQNVKLFVDYHSYGQLFMRPWGYTSSPPAHENEMKKLNEDCAAAIKKVNGATFTTGRISITIYPASGSTADWGYGTHGIFSYAVELRGSSFVVPPTEIEKSGKEQFAAVLVMADYVLNQ